MLLPRLEIVGVYRPEVSPELFDEQYEIYGDEDETKQHFANLVLVEAVVHDSSAFEMDDFGQDHPDGSDRAAYEEALLTSDGTRLTAQGFNAVAGEPPLRFAFFLHDYRPDLPLRWTGGNVSCPAVQELPSRLRGVVPYCPMS